MKPLVRVVLGFGALLGWSVPTPAHASGRWYAWLDRVPSGAAVGAAVNWQTRGVPVTLIPSDRLYGVDGGFTYLVAADALFKADAETWVNRLQAGGFTQTGIQYFSDAVPQALLDVLGGEPVFAIDAELDGAAPPEIVALTRGPDGDLLRIVKRHVDGTLSVEASHSARLYDLPKVTEGERARVFPLVQGQPGVAVVFEAAFTDVRQASQWTLIFAFTRPDLRAPPSVSFVPGARSPVPTHVEFEASGEGLRYTVTVEGLKGGTRTRAMVWKGDRFIGAADKKP